LNISNIFELLIDEEVIVKRINSRSNIENRQDDKAEIIKIRIKKYTEETRPLSDYYSLNYSENYNVINGNQEIEMIQEDILKIVKK
jgi:adenylate kinase family enzyme